MFQTLLFRWICFVILRFLCNHIFGYVGYDAVDGINPVPPGMYRINYQPQLVQDFFHHQYHFDLSKNSYTKDWGNDLEISMALAMEPLFGLTSQESQQWSFPEFSWLTWLVASTCERLFKPTEFEFDANEQRTNVEKHIGSMWNIFKHQWNALISWIPPGFSIWGATFRSGSKWNERDFSRCEQRFATWTKKWCQKSSATRGSYTDSWFLAAQNAPR